MVPEIATVETTLDKVIEPIIESVTLEEAQIPAHPLEAPQGAPTEIAAITKRRRNRHRNRRLQ